MPTLAEILAEAKRLEDKQNSVVDLSLQWASLYERHRFYAAHGPRLARVAKKAVEVDALTQEMARLNDEPCTDGDEAPCPRCAALGETDLKLTAAESALHAEIRGDAAAGEEKP